LIELIDWVLFANPKRPFVLVCVCGECSKSTRLAQCLGEVGDNLPLTIVTVFVAVGEWPFAFVVPLGFADPCPFPLASGLSSIGSLNGVIPPLTKGLTIPPGVTAPGVAGTERLCFM
jgi:hypothetical protein